MKKKIFFGSLGLVLLSVIVVFVLKTVNEKKYATVEEYARTLEGYGAEIYLLGDLKPVKQVNAKVIDKITDETLKTENEDAFHLLIIADYEGTLDISDEELILARKYCEEKFYDLYYYGASRQEQLLRCGYLAYNNHPFLYSGYEFRNETITFEFTGDHWYDRTTDSYYANPYMIAMLQDVSPKMWKRHPEFVWEDILRDAIDWMVD